MINLEKFIEVMNDTFDAGFTKENMVLRCSPCGRLKEFKYACRDYKCEECMNWWRKEYVAHKMELKPCPFCGGAAGLTKEKIGYMKWVIGCTTKSCRGHWRESPLYDNPEEAEKAWNRRVNDGASE